jgi:hypothetical protein
VKTLSILLILIIAIASNASGQYYDSAMVFDMGCVGGPSGWRPWDGFPAIGAPLWIVGTIQSFGAPFSDVLPPGGTYEATYVFEGLSCASNWHYDAPGGNNLFASFFEGGFLRIYVDQTPDASPADVSTYRDGELVLEAILEGDFFLSTSDVAYLCPYPRPTQEGWFLFCGGSWFRHVSDGKGHAYRAYNSGCFWGDISEALRQMGYVGRSEGVIAMRVPVSVEPTTWGEIKALYR